MKQNEKPPHPKAKKEANAYDKILKENIEAVFVPLIQKYLGFNIISSKLIDPKLQTTLEFEGDSIRLVKTKEGEEFILHLEFQTENDPNMLFRFKEYDSWECYPDCVIWRH